MSDENNAILLLRTYCPQPQHPANFQLSCDITIVPELDSQMHHIPSQKLNHCGRENVLILPRQRTNGGKTLLSLTSCHTILDDNIFSMEVNPSTFAFKFDDFPTVEATFELSPHNLMRYNQILTNLSAEPLEGNKNGRLWWPFSKSKFQEKTSTMHRSRSMTATHNEVWRMMQDETNELHVLLIALGGLAVVLSIVYAFTAYQIVIGKDGNNNKGKGKPRNINKAPKHRISSKQKNKLRKISSIKASSGYCSSTSISSAQSNREIEQEKKSSQISIRKYSKVSENIGTQICTVDRSNHTNNEKKKCDKGTKEDFMPKLTKKNGMNSQLSYLKSPQKNQELSFNSHILPPPRPSKCDVGTDFFSPTATTTSSLVSTPKRKKNNVINESSLSPCSKMEKLWKEKISLKRLKKKEMSLPSPSSVLPMTVTSKTSIRKNKLIPVDDRTDVKRKIKFDGGTTEGNGLGEGNKCTGSNMAVKQGTSLESKGEGFLKDCWDEWM